MILLTYAFCFGRCSWCHLFTKYRNVALNSVAFGVKGFLDSSRKCRNRTKGVLGEAQSVQGYPPEVPKNMSQTKRTMPGQFQANGSQMGAHIWIFVVFLITLSNYFVAPFLG